MFIDRTFTNPSGHALTTTVTIKNPLMGYKREAVIPCALINAPQIHLYLNGEKPASQCFPKLNASEVEFIISGMNEKEQRAFFDVDDVFQPIRFAIVDK